MRKSENGELVLLLGFSRSGTTWLAKVLDSMPSVYLVSEPDKRTNRQMMLGRVPHCASPDDIPVVNSYIDGINQLRERFYICLNKVPFFNKDYFNLHPTLYRTLLYPLYAVNSISDRVADLNISIPFHIISKKEHDSPPIMVWKSTNQSSNLPALIRAFPGIRIIYILRNPFAVISSILSKKFWLDGEDYRRICDRKSAPFFKMESLDFGEISYMSEIEKKAFLWRIECESAMAVGAGYEHFKCIVYKDLASDPFRVVHDLFDWLGWDLTEQTKKFLLESSGRKKTPSIAKLLGSGFFGVYREPGGNLDGWKSKLSRADYKAVYEIVSKSPLFDYWKDDCPVPSTRTS